VIWRNLPNALSVFRILVVPPAMAALAGDRFWLALLLILTAGVTDALDGYLARRFKWTSRLGSILDPIADKLLVVATYVTLAWLDHVPVWLTVLIVGRDVVIMTGAMAYHNVVGVFDMAPTLLSKANSAFQILFAVLVLANLGGLPVPGVSLQVLMWGVACITVGSGLHYVWIWGVKAAAHRGREL